MSKQEISEDLEWENLSKKTFQEDQFIAPNRGNSEKGNWSVNCFKFMTAKKIPQD